MSKQSKGKRPGCERLKRGKHVDVYSYELRLRAVRLHEEKGLTYAEVARRLGMSDASVCKWVKRYRDEGKEGLKLQTRCTGRGSSKQRVG